MSELNIGALRETLWEDVKKLRAGETTAANVNAVTNATGKILSTIKLQMEYCKLTGKPIDIGLMLTASEN